MWNKKNIFTGWVDIPLSREGINEALKAGEEIRDVPIDVVYTSTLIRGIMTALLALAAHHAEKVPVIVHADTEREGEWGVCHEPKSAALLIPVFCAWELNERMYGELQGRNKQETREKFGEEQVQIWRRSFSTPPPQGESLRMTAARTLPYFASKIVPQLEAGKHVLVAAHGNSLRSIVMELDQLNEDEVVELEIPTGVPLFYRYQKGQWAKEDHGKR